MKRIGLVVLLAMACRSETEPLTGTIYTLASIAGTPLPAPYALSPDDSRVAWADTLALRPDGTGERRFVIGGSMPSLRETRRSLLAWSQSGSEITITLDCQAMPCVAGPHFVGTLGPPGTLTITKAVGMREPLVYDRFFGPD